MTNRVSYCRVTNRMYPALLRCSGAQDTLYWIRFSKDREIFRRVRSANKASVLREVFVSPLCRCNKVRIKHLVGLDSYKELTLNPSRNLIVTLLKFFHSPCFIVLNFFTDIPKIEKL